MIDQNRSSKKGRFRRIDCFQSSEEKWPIEGIAVEEKDSWTLNTTLDRSLLFPASTTE